MDIKDGTYIISYVIVTILIVLVLLFIKEKWENNIRQEILSSITITEIHDTIKINDTVIKYKTKILETFKYDTIIIYNNDTIRDSILVSIPIENKQYIDTICSDSGKFFVDLTYSGYKAYIQKLNLGYESTVTPVVVDRHRGFRQFVGLGIGVGYGGCVLNNRVYLSPEVSLNITYGFGFTWDNRRK